MNHRASIPRRRVIDIEVDPLAQEAGDVRQKVMPERETFLKHYDV